MKKIIALLSALILCLTLFGCTKKGDLAKQTTIDEKNGCTIVEEVLPYSYNDDEDELKTNPKAKFDGFVTGEKNPAGDIKIKTDALEIAKKEIRSRYNKINYNYDRSRGVWKIVFSTDTEKDEQTVNTKVATVYVDEDGYTLSTVIE